VTWWSLPSGSRHEPHDESGAPGTAHGLVCTSAQLVDGAPPVLRSRAGDTPLHRSALEVVRLLLSGEALPVSRIGHELATRLLAAAVLVADHA